jgi:hypothetical protein
LNERFNLALYCFIRGNIPFELAVNTQHLYDKLFWSRFSPFFEEDLNCDRLALVQCGFVGLDFGNQQVRG